MQIEINLDEMTERYVRSKEGLAEAYKARAWTMAAIGLLVGIVLGMFIGVSLPVA